MAARAVVASGRRQAEMVKAPLAPSYLAVSASCKPYPPQIRAGPGLDALAGFWGGLREVGARAEEVGDRFADEARRMHHGDTEARQIRGQASLAETLELLEEGVPVLPLPAALKETLQ